MNMIIHTMPNGDEAHRFDANIVIPFKGKRKVLSTAPHNGGYREDLTAVYNHDGRHGLGVQSKMKGSNFCEHMQITTREIGLDLEKTAGMATAAHMENASVKSKVFEDLTVTAIVTGGIEVNGARVGDPAYYVEKADVPQEYRAGTINIMLAIDADMSPGGMARALVTCTEAKTAAIWELLAESHYSRGLATGSGTDSTIIIADAESPRYLTNAGKGSKLGELIGVTVKEAVKEALYLQTQLGPKFQHSAIRRMCRFGAAESGIYRTYADTAEGDIVSRPVFADALERVDAETQRVVLASLLAHLIDQMDWGLLTPEEAAASSASLIGDFAHCHNLVPDEYSIKPGSPDETAAAIAEAWTSLTIADVLALVGQEQRV